MLLLYGEVISTRGNFLQWRHSNKTHYILLKWDVTYSQVFQSHIQKIETPSVLEGSLKNLRAILKLCKSVSTGHFRAWIWISKYHQDESLPIGDTGENLPSDSDGPVWDRVGPGLLVWLGKNLSLPWELCSSSCVSLSNCTRAPPRSRMGWLNLLLISAAFSASEFCCC